MVSKKIRIPKAPLAKHLPPILEKAFGDNTCYFTLKTESGLAFICDGVKTAQGGHGSSSISEYIEKTEWIHLLPLDQYLREMIKEDMDPMKFFPGPCGAHTVMVGDDPIDIRIDSIVWVAERERPDRLEGRYGSRR